MSGFHPAEHNMYKYRTKKKDETQEVEVDGKLYIITIPTGNQFKAMEKSQQEYKEVYDYLKANYTTRGNSGTPVFEKEESHVFEPHIRAIRKAFTETGLGWGKNCKFWYDNMFLYDSPLWEKTMYVAITPAEGSTIRRKKGATKPCEKEGTIAVEEDKVPEEKIVKKISAEEAKKEDEEDEGGETIYHGKKVYFDPFRKDWGTYLLRDEDGDPIGDYHPENKERPDSEEAKTKYNDREHFVFQAYGYDTDTDKLHYPSSEEEEGHQEVPIEWGMAMSKTYNKPYWYDKNDPSNRTWIEPPEVKKEREEMEKFEREYQEEKKRKEESEAQRAAQQQRQEQRRDDRRDLLRQRRRQMKEMSKKGGRRKAKKTLKKRTTKPKSTRRVNTNKRNSKKKTKTKRRV